VVGGRQRGASEKETSLLEEWLGARARLVETPLPRGGAELLLPHSTTQLEGCALAFVASKVHDNGMEPYISPIHPLSLPYISPISPRCTTTAWSRGEASASACA